MRVIVVGAGIGGLTCALTLAARDIQTVVLERAAVLQEAGAGVQLSPNATRVLIGLGLEAPLRDAAFAPDAAEVRDAGSGRLLLHTPLGRAAEARWGAPYLQIHRADLQALLLEAVRAEPRVQLRLGVAVTDVAGDASAAAILADGDVIEGDALVGADGVRSRIRAALFSDRPARQAGQAAWRTVVDAARLPSGLVAPSAMVWATAGRHAVHYFVRGGRKVNLVVVAPSREFGGGEESWTAPSTTDEMAAAFGAALPPPVAALIDATEESRAPVWRYSLHDRPPLERWSRGCATLLGDAAHPLLPFLAQGAAMAIEDAAVLARSLGGRGDVEAALVAYEAERRPRTRRVQAWSTRNAALFHLPPLVARAVFGAAALQAAPERRLDWLYGYDAG